MCLWSSSKKFYIIDEGSSSRITCEYSKNAEVCYSTTIDDYVNSKKITCDLIKLDFEGAELEVLKASLATIKKYSPKLQISLYHAMNDYIEIPFFLMDKFKEYDYYIGHHSCWIFETCLYACKR